ncbi:4-hydroxy-tetrahydrodipicolinate synthase [Corynebacterium uterequi]|uniref:4-hydroxy-tetrahydrodipicolinate synthase n=1 Tax=Corynebacterium uterequi TaxID=1072256 RepID=A0A0G3HDC4_9CORY|nr:4-hydroxy-tetrahydrodipicolinate synthase [Corynebacterium uterequi]AKK11314.1 dihydrodipicolinate synthase [Corynebacterium uterequi]
MSTGLTVKNGSEEFGTVCVAMVTPFDQDGALDVAAGRRLAAHLVDNGVDALVLAGTTGESPTTTLTEKLTLLAEVKREVGERARIIAGAGTNNTAASVELARASAEAGADALLVVTPYYSKPSQPGLIEHFTAVAGATDLPVCLYDIPGRAGVEITSDTIRRLAELDTVKAVKDAKGQLGVSAPLIEETGLAWYSGDDPLNLPFLAIGATGFISVVGHAAPQALRQLHTSFEAGDLTRAREINATVIAPLTRAQARLGGATMAKAALRLQGIEVGDPRLPVVGIQDNEVADLRRDMEQAGVL